MKRMAVFFVGAVLGGCCTALGLHAYQSKIDPVKLSPQYYTVRIDNDRVRVVDYHLKSGEREPMHTHQPGIVFVTNGAKLRITQPDGSATESEAPTGEVFCRDTTTHSVENTGNTEARALAVELKPCGK